MSVLTWPSVTEVSPHPFLDAAPLAIAHRGGALLPANEGIENTAAAFSNAVALGYRYLETDVHVSADGVVYAFHDADLHRTVGIEARLEDLPSGQVDEALVAGREPLPRLGDLLEEFPDAHFNIDVKSDRAVEPTAAVVNASGVADRVCLASFSQSRLLRLRELCPDAARSAGPTEVAALRYGPLRAVRALVSRHGVDCVQIPVRRGPARLVTRGMVRHAHALGVQVHVWTVDAADEMTRLLDLGVDGIVTDRPDVLKDVLIDRGTWREP